MIVYRNDSVFMFCCCLEFASYSTLSITQKIKCANLSNSAIKLNLFYIYVFIFVITYTAQTNTYMLVPDNKTPLRKSP